MFNPAVRGEPCLYQSPEGVTGTGGWSDGRPVDGFRYSEGSCGFLAVNQSAVH